MVGAGKGEIPISTKIILSHHDYDETPGDDVLDALVHFPTTLSSTFLCLCLKYWDMFMLWTEVVIVACIVRLFTDSSHSMAIY